MGREKEYSKEQKVSADAVMEVKDVDGNTVRIPMRRRTSLKDPEPDAQGHIPEFVNISGQVQAMTIQNDPMGTLHIEPWGILAGEQWRSFSEPSPAWGRFPKFVERRRRTDGTFDPVYLLDVDQVISEVELLRNCDPDQTSYERLDGFQENGKVKTRDRGGNIVPGNYAEDREKVLAAIGKQLGLLKKRWDVKKKDLGIMD